MWHRLSRDVVDRKFEFMHPGFIAFIVVWSLSALAGAMLLTPQDRAGTGFVLGAMLGPLGVLIIVWRRKAWEARWDRDAAGAEEARKEQAFRDWRAIEMNEREIELATRAPER